MENIARMERDQRADGDKSLSTAKDSLPHLEADPSVNGKSNLINFSTLS